MKNSALVVIDLQNDITKNYKEIIGKVNEAIDWATQKEMWVVYIQHNILSAKARMFKPGTHGAELVPELNVVSDHIFTKAKNSALTSEAFVDFIKGARHYRVLYCRCGRCGLHQIHLLQSCEKRLHRSRAVGLHHELR